MATRTGMAESAILKAKFFYHSSLYGTFRSYDKFFAEVEMSNTNLEMILNFLWLFQIFIWNLVENLKLGFTNPCYNLGKNNDVIKGINLKF